MANYQVFPGPGASKAANKRMNKSSDIKTRAAKAGIDMTRKAIDIKAANAADRAAGKTRVEKINSNPVKNARTTGGITGANAKNVNPVYRNMGRGGGAGGGGLLGPEQLK